MILTVADLMIVSIYLQIKASGNESTFSIRDSLQQEVDVTVTSNISCNHKLARNHTNIFTDKRSPLPT